MGNASETVIAIAAATARERMMIAARRGEPMAQPGDQLAALLDTARTLTDANIPYALIGGIAVGIHAEVPRATIDVDIAVPTTTPRARVADVLTAAHFELRGEFEHSLNFRHETGEPVQVAFDQQFDDMIARAEPIEVAGSTIRIVSKEDLIAMKERAARDPRRRKSKSLRDRADLELLRGDTPAPDEGW
ncbi:MAG TPA: nucleotidyltransferase [Actinomycetota bacterium]